MSSRRLSKLAWLAQSAALHPVTALLPLLMLLLLVLVLLVLMVVLVLLLLVVVSGKEGERVILKLWTTPQSRCVRR